MGSVLDFGVVMEKMPDLLWGCLGTFGLAIAGMLLAMIIGVGGVITRSSGNRVLRLATLTSSKWFATRRRNRRSSLAKS
jgi:ABC-type amino acid transport system permease subunit